VWKTGYVALAGLGPAPAFPWGLRPRLCYIALSALRHKRISAELINMPINHWTGRFVPQQWPAPHRASGARNLADAV